MYPSKKYLTLKWYRKFQTTNRKINLHTGPVLIADESYNYLHIYWKRNLEEEEMQVSKNGWEAQQFKWQVRLPRSTDAENRGRDQEDRFDETKSADLIVTVMTLIVPPDLA